MSELSLNIFNTFNFLKHQLALDWSEISSASHRTRCIVCIFSGYSLKKEQRKVKAVLSSGKKRKQFLKLNISCSYF